MSQNSLVPTVLSRAVHSFCCLHARGRARGLHLIVCCPLCVVSHMTGSSNHPSSSTRGSGWNLITVQSHRTFWARVWAATMIISIPISQIRKRRPATPFLLFALNQWCNSPLSGHQNINNLYRATNMESREKEISGQPNSHHRVPALMHHVWLALIWLLRPPI